MAIVKRKENPLDFKLRPPDLPTEWDYDKSVKKVKGAIYKWCNLTEDIFEELYIAREMLSEHGGDRRSDDFHRRKCADEKTWTQYCIDIGNTKSTINRWLAAWLSGALVDKMTGNAENYTQKETVDMIKAVLGEIDLDPASCDMAQKTVKAKKYFTKEQNGLNQKWEGRVFLNPPYGAQEIKQFTEKLIQSLPDIEAAILLTNDQTDTDWWHNCAINADIICIPDGRESFYTPIKEKTSPTNGQTFFYFGNKTNKFKQVFSDKGLLVKII